MRDEDIRIGMKVKIVDADLSQGHKPNGTILEVKAKHCDGISAHILSDNKVYLNERFEAFTLKIGDFVKITGRSIAGGEQCIGQTLKVKNVESNGTVWVDTKEWANMYEDGHYEVVEMSCDKTELRTAYAVMQKNCGIDVEDCVKVLRTAKDCELGWGVCWVSEMNKFVGKVGKVTRIDDCDGVKVCQDGEEWNFPFFVLEVVKKAEKLVGVTVGDKTFEVTREDADDIIALYCDDCEDDDDCDCDDDDF